MTVWEFLGHVVSPPTTFHHASSSRNTTHTFSLNLWPEGSQALTNCDHITREVLLHNCVQLSRGELLTKLKTARDALASQSSYNKLDPYQRSLAISAEMKLERRILHDVKVIGSVKRPPGWGKTFAPEWLASLTNEKKREHAVHLLLGNVSRATHQAAYLRTIKAYSQHPNRVRNSLEYPVNKNFIDVAIDLYRADFDNPNPALNRLIESVSNITE